jgi:hypothetical protein
MSSLSLNIREYVDVETVPDKVMRQHSQGQEEENNKYKKRGRRIQNNVYPPTSSPPISRQIFCNDFILQSQVLIRHRSCFMT